MLCVHLREYQRNNYDFCEFVDTLVVALRITEKADCSPPQMSFYRGNASPDTGVNARHQARGVVAVSHPPIKKPTVKGRRYCYGSPDVIKRRTFTSTFILPRFKTGLLIAHGDKQTGYRNPATVGRELREELKSGRWRTQAELASSLGVCMTLLKTLLALIRLDPIVESCLFRSETHSPKDGALTITG